MCFFLDVVPSGFSLGTEIYKAILQLVVIGGVGGFVSFYYTKLQKNRDFIFSLIHQTSAVHSDFLALRYKYNAFFIHVSGPLQNVLDQNDVQKLKWKYYEECCSLLSKYQSLKPLLSRYMPKHQREITSIDGHYQVFRRSIRNDKPIMQSDNGQSSDALKELKQLHYTFMKKLADRI